MKDRPDKGQAKELTINVYKGRMQGNMQLTNYQREVMQEIELKKMKGDLLYFAFKHRAPFVPTPAQLYQMKAITEQYEKTGEVKLMVRKGR